MIRKHSNRARNCSKNQRASRYKPNDVLVVCKVLPLMVTSYQFALMQNHYCGAVSPYLFYFMAQLAEILEMAMSVQIQVLVRPVFACVVCVASALELFGDDGFVANFGVTPAFATEFAWLLFGNEVLKSRHKHGKMGGELALLILLARLRQTSSTLAQLAWSFGYYQGETKFSDLAFVAAMYIRDTFGHLLALENMGRFAHMAQQWATLINNKYMELVPEFGGLRGMFVGVNCLIDCIRTAICRPIEGQEAFWSG